MNTKTRIVATVGPASADIDTIQSLIEQGVTTFRLNFSHGTIEDHNRMLAVINKAREDFFHCISVMGDLCGPKIRIADIQDQGQVINTGEQIIITNQTEIGTPYRFGTNYESFTNDVQPGQRVLIDDGNVSLEIIEKNKNEVICKVVTGGEMYSHKGINLPDSALSVPAITEKDFQFADWAIENELDYLALSFVRTADEVMRLKDHIAKAGSHIRVISKIEKPEAVKNTKSIINASDGIIVARGDLGVEMDLAKVPLIQKEITNTCRQLGKPVIVATQVLQSMIVNPSPTRAEISDAANAIMDYTDALMLSGETAVGRYPVQAVKIIKRVSQTTEAYLDGLNEPRPKIQTSDEFVEIASIARNIAQIVDDIRAKLVVVWTNTGTSARFLSKARIDVPILAFCPNKLISRQISLHYGVTGFFQHQLTTMEDFVRVADRTIIEQKLANVDDEAVFITNSTLLAEKAKHAIIMHSIKC
jgi:pyruvate kinase